MGQVLTLFNRLERLEIRAFSSQINDQDPIFTLPLDIIEVDIEVTNMDGSHFSGHIDYIKTTIVNAFATSESMQYGANKRISKAVGDKIGKNVSIVTR